MIKAKEAEPTVFKCETCGKEYKSKRALIGHTSFTHKRKPVEAAIVAPAIAPRKEEHPKITQQENRPIITKAKVSSMQWYKILAGIGFLLIGVSAGVYWYFSLRDDRALGMLVAAVAVIPIPIGIWLFYNGLESTGMSSGAAVFIPAVSPSVPTPDGGQSTCLLTVSQKVAPAGPKGEINCLTLYAYKGKDGKIYPLKIALEYMENPVGQLGKIRNTGEWVHKQIMDVATGQIEPFNLPDTQYYSPAELANILEDKPHKDLYALEPSLLQIASPFIMLGAVLIIGFVLIAVSG